MVQHIRIERSISWLGMLTLLFYSILACWFIKQLLPYRYHRLSTTGGIIVLVIYFLQNRYWMGNFKKGVHFLKKNKWEDANKAFEATYHLFQKNPRADRFRFWLLISISAHSGLAMALRNMAFCQLMMQHQKQASFYYKDLLQLSGSKKLSLPLLQYFE